MKQTQAFSTVQSDQYLNSANIVQGLPVTQNSDNYSAKPIQQNYYQQQDGRAVSLNQVQIQAIPQPMAVKYNNQSEQRDASQPDPNGNPDQNHLIFVLRLWGYSALYFFLFCAIIFIQRFLYGYQVTYGVYGLSYLALLASNILAHRGSKKLQIKRFEWSFCALIIFFILQAVAFVFAVIYPIRYSFTNQAHNDAINDYQDYLSAKYEAEHPQNDYRRRVLYSESYDIKEVCQTLQTLQGYSSKSYFSYCNDVLNGNVDDSSTDRLAPLQIGLLLYYIVAIIGALIFTYIMWKRAKIYLNYLNQIKKITVVQTGQATYVKQKGKKQYRK